MNPPTTDLLSTASLGRYWQTPLVHANLLIAMNLAGALLLGWGVGFERSYNGRAAGARTYGLVCMASAALTLFSGYAGLWFGAHGLAPVVDPTRVVQGVVSGIGFLCAGVIMKDGLSISGLTTAASIWSAAAIGVLVGVGFYLAAISMAGLCMLSMSGFRHVQNHLPQRRALGVTVHFEPHAAPTEAGLARHAKHVGYELMTDSLAISSENGAETWKFMLVTRAQPIARPLADVARALERAPGVRSFSLEPARN